MLKSKSQNSLCEQEAKFVHDRINIVETHFYKLCQSFAAYSRKTARLRDKNDELANAIKTYGEAETFNRSLSRGLVNLARTLSVIGDYRDAEVQRIEVHVIVPLTKYELTCKHARESVKDTFSVREQNMEKLKTKSPKNKELISQAEFKLTKAQLEMTRVIKGLEEKIDSFEEDKLRNIKKILLDFITIQMSFHTKALELLTKAYQDIAEIDTAKDLEEFREVLNEPETFNRLNTIRRTSYRQSYSFPNLATLFSSPLNFRKTTSKGESLESLRCGLSNSSESLQMEVYPVNGGDSETEESDDDTIDDSPVRQKVKSY